MIGIIYKITNDVNNKVYIGQTTSLIENRWERHCEELDNTKFHKAIKEIGKEHFTISVIEKPLVKDLDEREIYWISKYNSYLNGYNSTIRGRDISLYNWDEEEIINLYHQEKSARKVAKIIRCDHSTIDTILNKNCIKRYTRADQASKPLYFKKGNEFYEFHNTTEAAQWLMDNGYTTVKNRKIVRQEITLRLREHREYFGFEVNYKE